MKGLKHILISGTADSGNFQILIEDPFSHLQNYYKIDTIKIETIVFAYISVTSIVSWHNTGIKIALFVILLAPWKIGYLHGTLSQ